MIAIEQTKDLSTLLVIELMCSLDAYEQRLKRHDEDSIENAFQSKLKLRSQNKENDEKKDGEVSINKHNSRNFSKTNQEKYSPCGIYKKISQSEKDCWHCGKPQCHYWTCGEELSQQKQSSSKFCGKA